MLRKFGPFFRTKYHYLLNPVSSMLILCGFNRILPVNNSVSFSVIFGHKLM
ncbi:hypothetical protein CSC02_2923 [Enterobacter hormaechei subsp. hoffmannii]|nr:hypothetical protein CSC02_2923 [Enterobacter hormaechei subsp. hoffmannii]